MWFEHSGFPDPAPDHCAELGRKISGHERIGAGLGCISLGRNVNGVCDAYNVQLSVNVQLLTMWAQERTNDTSGQNATMRFFKPPISYLASFLLFPHTSSHIQIITIRR